MASIREIARLAGTAPSTVSRALRNDPSIPTATRERIQAVAEVQHYSTDHWIQRLTAGRYRTIGYILPEMTNSFHARILRGVLEAADEAQYHVITVETHSLLLHTCRAIESLVERHVDAILIASEHPAPIARDAVKLMRAHNVVPISLDSTPFSLPVDNVSTNEDQLAETVVSYLMTLGHRSIAFVGMLPGGRLFTRGEAMARIMREHGLATTHFYDTQAKDHHGFNAVQIWQQLLRTNLRPTALITWEDHIAAKLMQSALELGIPIPQQMSIISCANMEFADLLTPPLTTIEQHPEDIGNQAIKLALERHKCQGGIDTQTITIPVSLIERSSCGRPYSAL